MGDAVFHLQPKERADRQAGGPAGVQQPCGAEPEVWCGSSMAEGASLVKGYARPA